MLRLQRARSPGSAPGALGLLVAGPKDGGEERIPLHTWKIS